MYPDEQNLTKIETLRDWLGDADNNADGLLLSLINGTSAFICEWIAKEQGVFSGPQSETRNGNNQPSMFVNVRPLTAVSLVQVNQTTYSPSVNGSWGYVFDKRQITLIGDLFWQGSQNVRLNYTGGIAAGSSDQLILEQACLAMCAYVWKQRGREEVANRVMVGVGTETFRLSDMPDRVREMLSNIRNVVPPW